MAHRASGPVVGRRSLDRQTARRGPEERHRRNASDGPARPPVDAGRRRSARRSHPIPRGAAGQFLTPLVCSNVHGKQTSRGVDGSPTAHSSRARHRGPPEGGRSVEQAWHGAAVRPRLLREPALLHERALLCILPTLVPLALLGVALLVPPAGRGLGRVGRAGDPRARVSERLHADRSNGVAGPEHKGWMVADRRCGSRTVASVSRFA
jgi:hypothetical protein